ncbi:hypothetical protein Xen7305DRAFT_00000260 [Xenococcus sp. PCC 7305]|uniref:hypothetical protein n=1 Tax=Xenococcus sp. PCC 7305 TaxID=102125 RepID=UPI0002ABEFC2|nr:hypothetical protein [Xenococcus sp. PCC 7305]ELS00326.1 hypothetical protein Xen7305DRAFT_00000260 [Xenococcus sp. PCC 7305]
MTKKYLLNPFNAVYQDNILLSNKPEIQELNEYAIGLEDKIAGDFDLQYLTFEFAYNQLAFVRNGLLLAKIKFLKLYKNYGDGTFASFCREKLRKQRWQINDTIRAARVVLELMYAGFDVLPTNISQAIALAKLTGEKLVETWRSIINIIPLDKITAKSIRNLLNPTTEKERTVTTIQVPPEVHEDIHKEAAERGLSIVELLKMMLEFFISSENSHLSQPEINTPDYKQKQQIWREDLAKLVEEQENSAILSP